MKHPLLLALLLVISFSAMPQEPTPPPFAAYDLVLETGDAPLAAYQVTVTYAPEAITLAGIEGGEPEPFREPPFYDPAGLTAGRIKLAAFSTARDLPAGRVRVARLHVQIAAGAEPAWSIVVTAAASTGGGRIDVRATLTQAGQTTENEEEPHENAH